MNVGDENMRKILALLLVGIMMLSFSACGRDDTGSDTDTSSITTTTENDSQSTAENGTTESTDSTDTMTDNSGSETSKPTEPSKSAASTGTPSTSKLQSISKPAKTNKPTKTKSPTKTNKPTQKECDHRYKFTFDGLEGIWSHTGKCTLCKEYVNKNIACADTNKDNKCDACSAKMDFGTAYKNVGYKINWVGLDFSDHRYSETPVLTAETIFMETRYKTKESDVKFNYSGETYIYSASEFEKVAKSLFNINNAKIAEMKALQQTRSGTLVNVYDSATKTYSYEQGAYGGGVSPEYLGYKKISDTEYAVYINDRSYDYVKVINCTYTDKVKISSICAVDSAPSDITRFG